MLTDPVCEREIVPTFYLIRFLDAAAGGVDRAAEADADRLDLVAREPGFFEQRRESGFDLIEDAGGAAVGIDVQALEGQEGSVAGPDSELELGAADLDAQDRRINAIRSSELRRCAVEYGLLRGETAEEVVDDPVEDDLVEGFDDAHVVDGRVEIVVGERLELAAGEAGDADGRRGHFRWPR